MKVLSFLLAFAPTLIYCASEGPSPASSTTVIVTTTVTYKTIVTVPALPSTVNSSSTCISSGCNFQGPSPLWTNSTSVAETIRLTSSSTLTVTDVATGQSVTTTVYWTPSLHTPLPSQSYATTVNGTPYPVLTRTVYPIPATGSLAADKSSEVIASSNLASTSVTMRRPMANTTKTSCPSEGLVQAPSSPLSNRKPAFTAVVHNQNTSATSTVSSGYSSSNISHASANSTEGILPTSAGNKLKPHRLLVLLTKLLYHAHMATSQCTPDDHQHEAGFLPFLTTVNEALPPAGFVDASEFILPSTTVTLPTTSTLTITTPGISKPLLTTRMTSTTTSTLTASASPRNPAPGNATWLGPYTVTIHEVSISNASMPIITLTVIPNNTISGSSDVTTNLGYTETSVIVSTTTTTTTPAFGAPATSANGAIAALLPNVCFLAGVLLGLWTWGI